jgi:drug/metabolite transporter (DMT)-like permease
MNPFRKRAYIELFIVAIIWGIAGPVIKITLGKIAPDLFILYRFLISSVIALIFFAFKGIKFPKDKITLIQFFAYCFLNSSVSLGLLFWGTSKTSLIDMSLISFFGPLLLATAGYFFLKDTITKREKTGTIIAFLGALIIGISPLIGTVKGDGSLLGNLLIFLSLVSMAISGVLSKKIMRKDVSPSLMANFSFIVGFITVFSFVLINKGINYSLSPILNIKWEVWLGILYMAIVSGNIAYILNNKGQKSIELSEAAPFAYLHPIFSAIIAVVFMADKLTLPIIIGSLITFIGVLLAEWKKRGYNS